MPLQQPQEERLTATSGGIRGTIGAVFLSFGEGAFGVAHELGRVLLLLVRVIAFAVTRPLRVREVFRLMDLFGVRSLPVIVFTGACTGLLSALQHYHVASLFGARSLISASVSLGLVRELGPLLTAVMVIARNASQITCDLAVMRRSSHFDALVMIGVDPVDYLVVPRVWAMLIIMPMLTVIFEFSGMVGGYLVCLNCLGIEEFTFVHYLRSYLGGYDVLHGLVKSVVFGGLVATIACSEGCSVERRDLDIGYRVSRSMVISMIFVLVSDMGVTGLMFKQT
ncbi:MAG: ABC transporter permease [Thermodesulfobacteriota bacterium]